MILITGAAGFIGSCVASFLNQKGFYDLILVDDFTRKEKERNYKGKKYRMLLDREDLFKTMKGEERFIQFVIHLGARTNTTEKDPDVLYHLNLQYSRKIWDLCTLNHIPLIYASSAATYGLGESGYSDDHSLISGLKPLNPYGQSKQDFDEWVLAQDKTPFFWAGLKFFNVFGPNEYHKGRMASVVWHAFNQISENEHLNLFKSAHPDFKNGEQLRDFIYVKDVVEVIYYLMNHRKGNGIYNLGTGKARTFNDLGKSVFNSLNKPADIRYIDMPEDLKNQYQYFTEAKMDKLRANGYSKPFYSLEDGIEDYVRNYLLPENVY